MVEPMKEATAPMMGLTVTDKLRLLLDITKKISSTLNLQEVLNLVMDTLDSLIPYDAAGIYVIKCEKRKGVEGELPDAVCVFRTEALRGYDIDELRDVRLKMGEVVRVQGREEPVGPMIHRL